MLYTVEVIGKMCIGQSLTSARPFGVGLMSGRKMSYLRLKGWYVLRCGRQDILDNGGGAPVKSSRVVEMSTTYTTHDGVSCGA